MLISNLFKHIKLLLNIRYKLVLWQNLMALIVEELRLWSQYPLCIIVYTT
jgi:hypothetical protein